MEKTSQLVTFSLGEQLFGIEIQQVQEILKKVQHTPVPLSSLHIYGLINLRGDIIALINIGSLLGICAEDRKRNIIVKHENEIYALSVSSVGDIVEFNRNDVAMLPESLEEKWGQFSDGIISYSDKLITLINIGKIINEKNYSLEEVS